MSQYKIKRYRPLLFLMGLLLLILALAPELISVPLNQAWEWARPRLGNLR